MSSVNAPLCLDEANIREWATFQSEAMNDCKRNPTHSYFMYEWRKGGEFYIKGKHVKWRAQYEFR